MYCMHTTPSTNASTDRRGLRRCLAALLATLAAGLCVPAVAAAVRWSPPVKLSRAERAIADPTVATDGRGDVVALWRSAEGILATFRPAGHGWQAAGAIATAGRGAPFDPAVAMDPRGDVLAVWERSPVVNAEVLAALRPVGRGWRAPVRLAANAFGETPPQAAMDARGDGFVLWQGGVETEGIWSDFLPSGKSWQRAEELSKPAEPGAELASSPQLAVDSGGAAVATWSLQSVTPENILESAESAWRPAGGNWQAPVTLANDLPGGSATTSVAIDPKGDALALWEAFEKTSLVQGAERMAGASWGPTELALSAETSDETCPRVALDSRGDAAAVAVGSHHGRLALRAFSRPAGGSWQAAVTLASLPGSYVPQPQLAMDARGDAVAAWISYKGSGGRGAIESADKPASGPWSAPTQLAGVGLQQRPGDHDTTETVIPTPRVTIGPAGEAEVVWFDYSAGADVVRLAQASLTKPRAGHHHV
jgi:hypothetical protein